MRPEAVGDFVRHVLPSGDAVCYRDADHSYFRDVKVKADGQTAGVGRLTGVSTCVGPFDWRPDTLMPWAARMNGQGVAMLAAEGLSLEDPDDMRAALAWLESAETIWRALQDAQATYEDLRDLAADRGTSVHLHALAAMAQGRSVPNFDRLTEEERGYARGVMAFWHECEPEPVCSEQVVADLALGVAGRLDLIARIGGRTVLVDCKTSGYIAAKMHVQVAGYAHCAARSQIGVAEELVILQVDADGGYELLPVQATPADFKAAVAVYRRAARIGRQARAQQRQAQAA